MTKLSITCGMVCEAVTGAKSYMMRARNATRSSRRRWAISTRDCPKRPHPAMVSPSLDILDIDSWLTRYSWTSRGAS